MWDTKVGDFAKEIGSDLKPVTEALKPLVGDAGDDALEVLATEAYAPFDDIKIALETAKINVPLGRLRKAVATLRVAATPAPKIVHDATAPAVTTLAILPAVPDDAGFLDLLKAGGELKIDKTTLISGLRAAIAHRAGLFTVPKTLIAEMERHAESLDEPVGQEFYELQK